MLLAKLVHTEQKHLEQLITDEAAEGLHLEFKEEFPGNWPDAVKKEVLADISAFANAGGGDLVYGIAEAEGSTYADRIVPQQIADLDGELFD
jgi:predicted HTH transcriptional regulator